MLYEQMSAAKAVKARNRRPAVQPIVFAAPVVQRAAKKPKAKAAKAAPAVKVSGGKAFKTGMALARAKCSSAESENAATRDRQRTLLSKGQYRDAEKVAREAAVGTLSTPPKLKDATDRAEHQKEMDVWKKRSLSGKVSVATACASECQHEAHM